MTLQAAVHGADDVGCASLVTKQFWGDMHVERGIGEDPMYWAQVGDEKVSFQVLDLPFDTSVDWPDQYAQMEAAMIRKAQGFVLVYAVDSMESLDALVELHERIKASKGNKAFPVVVCGNKIDLENRVVSREDGQAFADRIGAAYIEVSVVTGDTEPVFMMLAKQFVEWRKANPVTEEGKANVRTNVAKKKQRKKCSVC